MWWSEKMKWQGSSTVRGGGGSHQTHLWHRKTLQTHQWGRLAGAMRTDRQRAWRCTPVSIIQQSDIKVLQLGRMHLRRLPINKQSGLYYAWMILWKSAASHSKGGLWGRIKHFQQLCNHANATTTQYQATLTTCNCSKELKCACSSYRPTQEKTKCEIEGK